MSNIYQQWLDSFKSIGVPTISRDTAARLLAILYVYGGGNECFTHHNKMIADIRHIQDMYHFDGGEIPDAEVARLVTRYVKECEACEEANMKSKLPYDQRPSDVPEWAEKLLMDRYQVKLHQSR